MKYAIFSTLSCLAFFLHASPAYAAEHAGRGFSVSPPFQEVVVDKDRPAASFAVKITNNGALDHELRLSVLDFGALDESGGVAFLGETPGDWQRRYGLAPWVKLDKDALVVAPGETQTVTVTVDNRDSLSPGGHYAGLMAALMEGPEAGGNTVGVNQLFASLIFVKKLGGEIYDLALAETDVKGFYAVRLPPEVRLRFQNRGNVHAVPRGTIRITDPFGRVVASGVINSESSIIIPESYRVYPSLLPAVSGAFAPGRYRLSVEYRWDGNDAFALQEYPLYFLGPAGIIAGLAIFGFPLFLFVLPRPFPTARGPHEQNSKTKPRP